MRIGIVMIPQPRPGAAAEATVEALVEAARRIEALGFEGLWTTDSIGRSWPSLDPLIMLTAAAAATRRIELGTGVLQVPLRHPVELAHRVQSLNVLSAGRLRLGVGAGSTRDDFQAVQADYEGRFKALPAALEVMRRTWRGDGVFGPPVKLWPGTEGGPPVLLGAWRSQRWIDLAAQQCQGWIASGIHTSWEDLGIGLDMFRKAGGRRAVIANVFADLRPEPESTQLIKMSKINLICGPAEARERLKRLADTGIDDALIVCPWNDPGQLETIRGLY